ncbi:Protein tyrosine kinase [Phytophthora infestans]|uniref:Protein tyrosine kinase n=1 Tax=Phytophthora infestans TaxID=4787 RepID=A0A833VUJ0_PHYIN|nr:Protein tyrosine kinase [Phytophthora infestans]
MRYDDSLRPTCEHLCSRLKDLHEELEFTKHKSQSFSTNALGQCKAVATKFLRFLERNSNKNLVYHVINHTAVAGELKALHEEVSELFFDFLDVTAVGQWEDDRHALETVLTTAISDASIALRDLQSPRAQLEAMLTLKFELEKQHERHNETDKARMSSLNETIIHRSRVAVGQLPAWFLPSNQVEFESQPFAKSSCGSVHRGVKNDSPVVVKCCAVDDMRIDIRTARQLEKELDRLFQMEHTHIVKMLGACHVSSPPFLVYEDAINGDMGSYLSLSEDNKKEMWKLLYQAALGLAFIHSQGVIHGCLKLSNILVGADGQARLTDFGLRTMRAISKTRTCSSAHLRWRAPECLTRRPTFASDVYSLAMCMIEASAGEPPFAFLDDDDVRETLKSGVVPEKPQEMSDQVWELVVSMTHADPSKRVELTLVIDTLKTLATEDLGDGGVTRCITNRPRAVGRRHTSHLPSVVVELDATSSIVDLVAVLRSGSIDEQESAVLLLLQACICDHTRQQMQQENGLSALEDLVKTGRTHLLQVCALGCLCWSCELDSTPPDAEFEALQEMIGAPTESECASLAQMLRNNDHDTLRTVMYCACAAGANGRRQLFNAGVVRL